MKQAFLGCFVVLLISFAALSSLRADTDQRCLVSCIGTGRPAAICLPQCSYNLLPSNGAPKTASTIGGVPQTSLAKGPIGQAQSPLLPMSHNVFRAPLPIANEILLAPQPVSALLTKKDYTCFNQCLVAHWQYQMCNQICSKSSCPPGSNLCRDLTGVTPNAAAYSEYLAH